MGKLRFLPKESLMHRNRGFTLVEVLVAIAVSSIALASLYVAYDIIERRYTKLRETAIMQQTGRSVLRIIERDIRIAGFRYQEVNNATLLSYIRYYKRLVDFDAFLNSHQGDLAEALSDLKERSQSVDDAFDLIPDTR